MCDSHFKSVEYPQYYNGDSYDYSENDVPVSSQFYCNPQMYAILFNTLVNQSEETINFMHESRKSLRVDLTNIVQVEKTGAWFSKYTQVTYQGMVHSLDSSVPFSVVINKVKKKIDGIEITVCEQ